VQGNGYIVDCVPFDQQPGLINASAADKATAIALNNKHLAAMAKAGNGSDKIAAGFDFKVTMCPESTVALARVDANNLQAYIKVAPPQKIMMAQNQSNSGQSNLSVNSAVNSSLNSATVGSSPGYSWIQSYISNGTINTPGYYVSFISPDPQLSNNYMATNSNGHSLNQLWWLDKQNTDSFVYSLEAGWITQPLYQQVSTELFVFSTPDGYTGSAYDRYNQDGGFIQYSDTPVTMGTPLTSAQKFTLSFVALPNNNGYELRYSANGTTQGIGYYAMSRFPSQTNFNYIWYGSEINDLCGLPITMGGTITAAGMLDESGNITQSYLPTQITANILGEFNFSYVFNDDGSITYSGTNGSTPTPAPTGQPTGVYTVSASAINWDGSHLSAVYNGVTTPVLDYAAVCAAGSQVGKSKDVLACYQNTTAIQDLLSYITFSPTACSIQDVRVDTSSSDCSNATPQNAPASCINQLQAYCKNSSGSYVQTTVNPNGTGCYDATSGKWNIALDANGQLYCPSSTTS
jgi:hypothetical protein